MKDGHKVIYFKNDLYDPKEDMGYLKHAIVLTFYMLYLVADDVLPIDQNLYYFALRQTTLLGGDTDTNGAIVGGMIGALVGVQNIDEAYLITCLECDISQGTKKNRPDFV